MNFFKKISFFNNKITEKMTNFKNNVKESMSEGVDILKNVVYEIKKEIRVKTTDTFSLGKVAKISKYKTFTTISKNTLKRQNLTI